MNRRSYWNGVLSGRSGRGRGVGGIADVPRPECSTAGARLRKLYRYCLLSLTAIHSTFCAVDLPSDPRANCVRRSSAPVGPGLALSPRPVSVAFAQERRLPEKEGSQGIVVRRGWQRSSPAPRAPRLKGHLHERKWKQKQKKHEYVDTIHTLAQGSCRACLAAGNTALDKHRSREQEKRRRFSSPVARNALCNYMLQGP